MTVALELSFEEKDSNCANAFSNLSFWVLLKDNCIPLIFFWFCEQKEEEEELVQKKP